VRERSVIDTRKTAKNIKLSRPTVSLYAYAIS
jgi:hypothetical protein